MARIDAAAGAGRCLDRRGCQGAADDGTGGKSAERVPIAVVVAIAVAAITIAAVAAIVAVTAVARSVAIILDVLSRLDRLLPFRP